MSPRPFTRNPDVAVQEEAQDESDLGAKRYYCCVCWGTKCKVRNARETREVNRHVGRLNGILYPMNVSLDRPVTRAELETVIRISEYGENGERVIFGSLHEE